METIILSKDQYLEMTKKLDEISKFVLTQKKSPDDFIDNCDFLELMKISKRTAQMWRDEGKISFSQIGNKIYYRRADVETLLKNHYNKSFIENFNPRFK